MKQNKPGQSAWQIANDCYITLLVILVFFFFSEVLPATSHHPVTRDLVGVDPGDHKWAMMGMAPFHFAAIPESLEALGGDRNARCALKS